MRTTLLIISLLLFSFTNAQKRIKPKKLIEDFDYLIAEFKLQHQGLYNYIDKNQTDKKIDSIRNTLRKPQSKLKFYEKLRYVIGLTNEGHTSIELPKWTMIKLGLSKSFLPLTVKVFDDNLIISQNYGKNIKEIKRGAKIVSINDEKVSEILKELYNLIPTDGFNETSKKEWIGGINFSLLYRLVFGKQKKFKLELQEYGSKKLNTINIPAIRYTKFKNKNAQIKIVNYYDFDKFKFEQINDSIAYLNIPSFGDDDIDYENFYQSNFKKIDSLKIKHLIIDVQANGGGTEGNENLLFSYLSNKIVKKYKDVTMLSKPYKTKKSKQEYIEDGWTLKDSIAKRGNFTLYSDYYSDLRYKKPEKELIYKGKLYVLVGGRTFSGGAEFSSLIKMTNRGVFIGEETGGTYQGNVSGYSEYITLPNSKIEIKIPIVHFKMNVSLQTIGRGVIPKYNVPQTTKDYLNGRNTKKDFTIKMITE